MATALMDLAWAALPEKAIIARLANKVLREGLHWTRGDKGKIREIVSASCPPRGRKMSRVRAVAAEISRQKEIRYQRAANAPIDWSKWKAGHPARRRERVYEFLLGKRPRACYSLQHWQGHVVMLAKTDYYACQLVIRHPGGRVDRVSVRYLENGSLGEAVASINPRKVGRAIADGAAVSADFCRLCTIIIHPDGRREEFPWVEINAKLAESNAREDKRPPCARRAS